MYPDTPGRAIVRFGWIANLVFAVTAIPAALGVDFMLDVAIGVSLVLFLIACGAFLYAFGVGIARSARGDNVAVANLFFLQGSAPRDVQRTFIAMFVVCLVIAVATIVSGAVRDPRADAAAGARGRVGCALREVPAARRQVTRGHSQLTPWHDRW